MSIDRRVIKTMTKRDNFVLDVMARDYHYCQQEQIVNLIDIVRKDVTVWHTTSYTWDIYFRPQPRLKGRGTYHSTKCIACNMSV